MRIGGGDLPGAAGGRAGPVSPQAAPAGSGNAARRLEELRAAGRQFESVLLREMVRAMVAGSTEGGFFGGGAGAGAWEDILETGLSESLAAGEGLGVGNQIYRQLEGLVRRQARGAQEPADPADI